ncbi:uncharacterized protein LOC133304748 [Gastrolobium bilobum]|uniref:uncharacterized protein LOC133304748 n=1 Tax=Gastrolobium bilobum TaxID=150636 RepID=UPI002AB0D0F0|nr:uncharacterized protein LOC133304748 [Gastrolobium bilobum]
MPPTIFFSHEKPKDSARMSSRHRPLHACGVSIFAIADIAFGKTQDMNGPIGSTLRRVAKLAKFFTPLIYAIQYQWLAILSFIDDRILAVENMTEKLFPPSTYVFDKVDEIVLMILSLPENFDGVVNEFPTIIHKVPFLEWALTHVIISSLNSLVSMLNNWGHENSRINEKTIGVDSNCNEQLEGYLQMDSSDVINSSVDMESFPPISDAEIKEVHDMAVSSHMKGTYKEALEAVPSNIKGSYKEALEKGKEEKMEKEWKSSEEKIDMDEGSEKNDRNNKEGEYESIMTNQVGTNESIKNDSLLELFESAWLMKPGRY